MGDITNVNQLALDSGFLYSPTTNFGFLTGGLCIGANDPVTYLGMGRNGLVVYDTTYPSFCIADDTGTFLIYKEGSTLKIDPANAAVDIDISDSLKLTVGGILQTNSGRLKNKRKIVADPCTLTSDSPDSTDHHIVIDFGSGSDEYEFSVNLPEGVSDTEYFITVTGTNAVAYVGVYPYCGDLLMSDSGATTLFSSQELHIVYDTNVGWVGGVSSNLAAV